jgi:UDP-N-acetylglucosamine acyltransferase
MGTSIGKDVPAFVTVAGSPAVAKTINTEGLRRRGFEATEITALRRGFKILYRQGFTLEVALERLQTMVEEAPCIQMLIDSLQQSQRGIVR